MDLFLFDPTLQCIAWNIWIRLKLISEPQLLARVAGVGQAWKGRVFSKMRDSQHSLFCREMIYTIFKRLSWSFQQNSSRFGEHSMKVILLSETFQQKSACFLRAFGENNPICAIVKNFCFLSPCHPASGFVALTFSQYLKWKKLILGVRRFSF